MHLKVQNLHFGQAGPQLVDVPLCHSIAGPRALYPQYLLGHEAPACGEPAVSQVKHKQSDRPKQHNFFSILCLDDFHPVDKDRLVHNASGCRPP